MQLGICFQEDPDYSFVLLISYGLSSIYLLSPRLFEMNARELVDPIRSGLRKLWFSKPIRLRRRTPSNPCDFNDFLRSLQYSATIQSVSCFSQLQVCITEVEWFLLTKTLEKIRGIQTLNVEFVLCSTVCLRGATYPLEIHQDDLFLLQLFESTQPCITSPGLIFVLGRSSIARSCTRPCTLGIVSVFPPEGVHRRAFSIGYRTLV
jgi:hypothetical protein